jgi:hypothetical protein
LLLDALTQRSWVTRADDFMPAYPAVVTTRQAGSTDPIREFPTLPHRAC